MLLGQAGAADALCLITQGYEAIKARVLKRLRKQNDKARKRALVSFRAAYFRHFWLQMYYVRVIK